VPYFRVKIRRPAVEGSPMYSAVPAEDAVVRVAANSAEDATAFALSKEPAGTLLRGVEEVPQGGHASPAASHPDHPMNFLMVPGTPAPAPQRRPGLKSAQDE
jgi:hypothetical protein